MPQVYATPGVYIEEKSAFASSAVPVATAVPAFIGYTEKAIRNNKSIINVPTRLTSLNEYHEIFGGAPKIQFDLQDGENGEPFKVEVKPETNFYLYNTLRLFFSNGGSTCYIIAVGTYDYTKGVETATLNPAENDKGLKTLLKEFEPTMVVIPDAVLLSEPDCFSLQQAMVMHCGFDMRNRVALLDVYNGHLSRTMADDDVITKFREGIGINHLQWAAAYYPWVESTVVPLTEIDLANFANPDVLKTKLTESLSKDKADEKKTAAITLEIEKIGAADTDVVALHQTLFTAVPLYKAILTEVRQKINILPPSGAMAGVLTMVDNAVGVAKSPANVSMGSVVKPTVNITNAIQEDLNLPLNGKAVNAIRSFPGKGVLVWGARTLDGNSQDWRYLSVRRTIIMIEQSLKIAAEAYVFEPNVSNTWVTVKGMMNNFLTDQWKRGSLAGAIPEDAFSVDIGLGVTMTPTDVLDGIMRITVRLAVVRPAEFIVITFQQQMQKS
jgi:phage tail sheath protein FI